ncbi:MAG TPA: hypothetical protein VKQ34_03450 [Candidatus Saccharimonadales bacterium]|nr:hypothetical protein [Candidatus Saccharimonadales bacterium]
MKRLQRYITVAEHFLARHPWATCGAVVAACFLLAISRRPELLFHAQFWAEDGAVWYTDAFHRGFIAPLFETYAGYLSFFQRLVAGASLLLPLRFVPLFFNLWGIAALLLPVFILNSPRLRNVIPSRLLAIAVSILYIGMPNGNEVYGNLTNVQWHLGVAVFLLLIATPSKKLGWIIFDFVVFILAGLSSPLLIVLLPVVGILWWRNRRDVTRRRNLLVFGVLSLVQLWAIFVGSHYHRVGSHVQMDFLNFVKMIVGQIFMGGTVGLKYVNLYYNDRFVLYALFALGLATIVYAVVKGPLWLKLFNIYWPLLLLAMFNSLAPVPGFNVWEGLTNPTGGQRYWYIPIMSWIATLIWLACKAPSKWFKGMASIVLLLMVIVGLGQNWEVAPLTDLHFQQYAQDFQRAPKGKPFAIPINPGWKMILYKK